MLAALESLNCAVLTAMDTTKLVSGGADGGGPKMRAGGVCCAVAASTTGLRAVELEAWVLILAPTFWLCIFTSLGLSFLICKLGIIIEPTSRHLL